VHLFHKKVFYTNMKNTMKNISLLLLAGVLILAGCRSDEYDGLLNIDPVPANAVTFPDATVNGFTLMDDNAFIINQNAAANGRVEVRIKGPSNKNITQLVVRGQRFRGAIAAPNISPTVPTAAASRAPSAFSRTATAISTVNVTPAPEVTYTLNLNSLPATLTGSLGAVQVPADASQPFDVFRFFFTVTYDDGSSVVSNEVRVVVRG
jgi:hypothetical protein